jgi:hypothetical protein
MTYVFRFGAALTVVLAACHAPGQVAVSVNAKPVHHYVFFGQDREKIAKASSFLETRALEGAQVAYTWRQLEPEKDAYDFRIIREDLAFLTSRGKKLFVQLQDVTFSEARINVPLYLLHDPVYNGGADKQYGFKDNDEQQPVVAGWAARRWDPAVQKRLHKLLLALGKEFDGRIEGINFAETSVDFGETGRWFPKRLLFRALSRRDHHEHESTETSFPKISRDAIRQLHARRVASNERQRLSGCGLRSRKGVAGGHGWS